jgi:hypothetical protein
MGHENQEYTHLLAASNKHIFEKDRLPRLGPAQRTLKYDEASKCWNQELQLLLKLIAQKSLASQPSLKIHEAFTNTMYFNGRDLPSINA